MYYLSIIVNMIRKGPQIFPSEAGLLASLGERLRLARLRRKFTTTLVANRSGISRTTLMKIEKGDSSVTLGAYLRVLAIYGLENDLSEVAEDDKLGRRLQDLALPSGKQK